MLFSLRGMQMSSGGKAELAETRMHEGISHLRSLAAAKERIAALKREIGAVINQLESTSNAARSSNVEEEETANHVLHQVGTIEKHTRALVAVLDNPEDSSAATEKGGGGGTACEFFAYPAACVEARDATELPMLLLTNASVETERADDKALECHMHEHANMGLNEQFVKLNQQCLHHNTLVEAALESVSAARAKFSKRNDYIRQQRSRAMTSRSAAPRSAGASEANPRGLSSGIANIASINDTGRQEMIKHMMRAVP